MKNLIIIIHKNGQETLSDLLRTLDFVPGFTFTKVEGHSSHSERDHLLSARDKVVGYVPRVRVDILLENQDADRVLDAIRTSLNGGLGGGVYWCVDVEKSGRL
ncbi:MAG: hypothetical protein COB54_01190 [Alphaproteobacteria bacterium]|nr:MAG: hypothetical protein COB54_01190 [Alphaproteobacteria bacterium]